MEFLVYFAGLVVLFIGFGTVAVIVDYRKKARDRELSHAERLKALELGQALPDAEVHWAQAEASRARAGGTVAVMVPLAMAVAAAVATWLIFAWHVESYLTLLCVIWGVCGVVSLVAVTSGLAVVGARPRFPHPGARAGADLKAGTGTIAEAFQERPSKF